MKRKRKKAAAVRKNPQSVEKSRLATPKVHPALAAAIARGEIARKKISTMEGGSMSAQNTADLLGISFSEVIHQWRSHRLIGWQLGKTVRFPVWQFCEGKLLKGIEEILQIFRSDDHWRVMLYFVGNRRSLANERPLDLLRRGEVDRVIQHATDYSQANEW